MSIAEAPQPQPQPPADAAQPAGAAPPTAVRERRRAPRWLERAASPAITLLTAALIVFASAEGNTLSSATSAQILTILGGGALVAAAMLAQREAHVPGGWATAAFVALAAFTALSIAWAIDPPRAWLETNRTLGYTAAFVGAAALAVVARDRWPAFLGGLLLGVTLVCGLALLSKIVPEWLNENERFARLREPFGYWNAVGLTGALTVPLSLWLGSRRGGGSPAVHVLAYPALTLGITTMLLAYSRGSLVAAAAGAAVWFVLVPARRLRGAAILLVSAGAAAFVAAWTFGQNALTEDRIELAERGAAGRELLVCLVAILLLVYVAGLAVSFLSDLRPLGLRQRRGLSLALIFCVLLTPLAAAGALSATDEGLGGSVSTAWDTLTDPDAVPAKNDPGRLTQTGSVRARYWDDALRMARDKPLGGWGAGGFGTARPRFRTDTIDVEHAHGYIAQTLADLGFVGLGVSLLLLVAWGFAAWKAIRAAAGPRRTALVTLVATAFVFGVHSLIDWTWFTAGTALVGLLAAGFVAGSAPAGRWAIRVGGQARRIAAAAAVLVALACAWAAWQPLRSDNADGDALALADAGKLDQARAKAAEAHDLNPLSAEPYLTLATIERAAGDTAKAEQALRDAVKTQPANYQTWLRLAEFQLWIADRPQDALESVRAALFLNPGSYAVVQRYLDIYRTIQNRNARGGG